MFAPRSTSNDSPIEVPTTKRIVGIAEWQASAAPADTLITYALGSCLGIVIYDPITLVGGLVHVMLPTSALDRDRAVSTPGMFVDTGVAALLEACVALGARRSNLVITVSGGAERLAGRGEDHFQIGRRNVEAFRASLAEHRLTLRAHDVGGQYSRTMSLAIRDGAVSILRYDSRYDGTAL